MASLELEILVEVWCLVSYAPIHHVAGLPGKRPLMQFFASYILRHNLGQIEISCNSACAVLTNEVDMNL